MCIRDRYTIFQKVKQTNIDSISWFTESWKNLTYMAVNLSTTPQNVTIVPYECRSLPSDQIYCPSEWMFWKTGYTATVMLYVY